MERLVRRLGRTEFAALASLAWALPLVAWAGSVDLYPGAGPWVAFAAGLGLLGAWLLMLRWVNRIEVDLRPRRFDVRSMSGAERRWNTAIAACLVGLIGWLSASSTVDWRLLGPALAGGTAAPRLFVGAIGLLATALIVGAVAGWRRADAAFRLRAGGRKTP